MVTVLVFCREGWSVFPVLLLWKRIQTLIACWDICVNGSQNSGMLVASGILGNSLVGYLYCWACTSCWLVVWLLWWFSVWDLGTVGHAALSPAGPVEQGSVSSAQPSRTGTARNVGRWRCPCPWQWSSWGRRWWAPWAVTVTWPYRDRSPWKPRFECGWWSRSRDTTSGGIAGRSWEVSLDGK